MYLLSVAYTYMQIRKIIFDFLWGIILVIFTIIRPVGKSMEWMLVQYMEIVT